MLVGDASVLRTALFGSAPDAARIGLPSVKCAGKLGRL